MKTILVLTDFSISADYTAQYALALAQQIEANLLVCNIYEAPGGQGTAEDNRWPFPTDKENSINDLGAVVAHLKTRLDMQKDSKSYRPEIEQCSIEGLVGDHLSAIISKRNVILALVSAHTRDNLIGFLSIDNAWAIIDNASFPVLVIPYQVRFKPFNNIAFANATMEPGETDNIKLFFNQLPFKINYHHLPQRDATSDIDLLVIVHHKRNFFQKLFNGSMTRKLAACSNKPLLVFPGLVNNKALVFN
ncbi:MAG: universal stress protein [Mucilaginibacter sp.]|nr:universal stress protein [Mucilaginibacter sp.]